MKAFVLILDALWTLAMAWLTKNAIDNCHYGTAAFLALMLLVMTAHNIASGRHG